MGKKSKLGLAAVIGTAYGLANQAGAVPDAEGLYAIGRNAIISAKNEAEKKQKNDRIKRLLIEIGDRVITKNIKLKDNDIQDEIECINELEEKIELLLKKG